MTNQLWKELTQFSTIEDALRFMSGDEAIVKELGAADGVPPHLVAYKITGLEGSVVIAQREDGNGPVKWMEAEGKVARKQLRRRGGMVVRQPSTEPPKRIVGEWFTCNHAGQQEILEHWRHNAGTNEYTCREFKWMMAFRIGDDVYEYAERLSGGIVQRVLHRPEYRVAGGST